MIIHADEFFELSDEESMTAGLTYSDRPRKGCISKKLCRG